MGTWGQSLRGEMGTEPKGGKGGQSIRGGGKGDRA